MRAELDAASLPALPARSSSPVGSADGRRPPESRVRGAARRIRRRRPSRGARLRSADRRRPARHASGRAWRRPRGDVRGARSFLRAIGQIEEDPGSSCGSAAAERTLAPWRRRSLESERCRRRLPPHRARVLRGAAPRRHLGRVRSPDRLRSRVRQLASLRRRSRIRSRASTRSSSSGTGWSPWSGSCSRWSPGSPHAGSSLSRASHDLPRSERSSGRAAQIPLGGITIVLGLQPARGHGALPARAHCPGAGARHRSSRRGVSSRGVHVRSSRAGSGSSPSWAGLPTCAALVVTGAVATASGPHPGSSEDVKRIGITITDTVYVHVRVAAAFGIGVLIVGWFLWQGATRTRGSSGSGACCSAWSWRRRSSARCSIGTPCPGGSCSCT